MQGYVRLGAGYPRLEETELSRFESGSLTERGFVKGGFKSRAVKAELAFG